MPQRRIKLINFRRTLLRSVALPLALIGLLTAILLWQINNLLSLTRWVAHTSRAVAQAHNTEKLLVNMETGLRGYVITGDRGFLEPHTQAAPLVAASFNELARLVSDNPSPSTRGETYKPRK